MESSEPIKEVVSQEPTDNISNDIVQESANVQEAPKPQEVPINKIQVTDQNIALQLLIAFVQLGHRRGAYNIEETAKVHECIEIFKLPQEGN